MAAIRPGTSLLLLMMKATSVERDKKVRSGGLRARVRAQVVEISSKLRHAIQVVGLASTTFRIDNDKLF